MEEAEIGIWGDRGAGIVGQRSRQEGLHPALETCSVPSDLLACVGGIKFCVCRGIARKQEAEGGVEDTKKMPVKLVQKHPGQTHRRERAGTGVGTARPEAERGGRWGRALCM